MQPEIEAELNRLLAQANQPPLTRQQAQSFGVYLSLILRWNEKTNLTAIRDEAGILSRHFLECIVCARRLPADIRSLLDFGSGGGFPGIPIAICRPDIAVTLAESQGKKAAFLREVVRSLNLGAEVFSGRAETLSAQFDCVTLRAVDKMKEAVAAADSLVAPSGWLALLTTTAEIALLRELLGPSYEWSHDLPLPGSESRILAFGRKLDPSA